MKFVALSDTHGMHYSIDLPEADAIIHAGDVSKEGTEEQVRNFIQWFSSLPYKYKIFIAGNHDFYLEKLSRSETKKLIPENIIYLNDSGAKIGDLSIWGSPVQPFFFNWAFNRKRGEQIQKHWNLIPEHTSILITHGPPYQILDKNISDESVGCQDLLKRVLKVKPKVHLFGHIHESAGQVVKDGIRFINACVMDEDYKVCCEAAVFEV